MLPSKIVTLVPFGRLTMTLPLGDAVLRTFKELDAVTTFPVFFDLLIVTLEFLSGMLSKTGM